MRSSKVAQLRGESEGQTPGVTEGAELTAAFNVEIWLQRRSRSCRGVIYILRALTLAPLRPDIVILESPGRTNRCLLLYVESVRAKPHFIGSLQMYVDLAPSLRGLEPCWAHIC